jgi:hypothetical protein
MNSIPPNVNRHLVQNGSYGSWLHPYVNIASNSVDDASALQGLDVPPPPPEPAPEPEPEPVPARRGRGRPRVLTTRDASAIEVHVTYQSPARSRLIKSVKVWRERLMLAQKRRAQVRNAQRAYQERKDDAMAIEKKKHDAILQVLSGLAIEVEDLLKVASNSPNLSQVGELENQIRRLRDAHAEAINDPRVKAELKQLRSKHPERRTIPPCHADPLAIVAATEDMMQSEQAESSASAASAADTTLGRGNDIPLIAFYSHTHSRSQSKVMGGRNIFQIVAERQAAMRNAEKPR